MKRRLASLMILLGLAFTLTACTNESPSAESLDGLCNSAEKMLDGEIAAEEYNNTITEYTSGLTQASTLLTEGFEMLEE